MAALSRAQDGVLGIDQLRELGFSDDRVGLLVAQGRLVRRHRGVYGDALTKLTPQAQLRGGLLAVGDGAFLSGRTSLAQYGVRRLDLRTIEVTIAAEHTPRHAGLRVHRTTVPPLADELRVKNGLLCASASLALVQVAAGERRAELDRLIAEMARRRLLHLDRIQSAMQRRRGLRGLPKLVAALDAYVPSPDPKSTLERDVAAWLAEHPEVPPPRRNVHIDRWEIDFHWPDQRVVLETDGDRFHLTPDELERDRVKDAWLQRHDLKVLRVTGFRYAHDRPGILADLIGMLDRA